MLITSDFDFSVINCNMLDIETRALEARDLVLDNNLTHNVHKHEGESDILDNGSRGSFA